MKIISATAIYAHADNDSPGSMTLHGTADDIKAEAKEFVAAGFRNQTWMTVDFGSSAYRVDNRHGKAIAHTVNY